MEIEPSCASWPYSADRFLPSHEVDHGHRIRYIVGNLAEWRNRQTLGI